MTYTEVIWTARHEAAYLEERKNQCEHCQPEQEETIAWLENISARDIVHTVFKKYGIHPKDVYREYEAEFASIYSVEEIEVFMQELAV